MPTPAPPSPLLDARQLARHLNVTVGFIHRKTSEGRIPRRKFGHRTVRYDLDEVLAALARDDADPPPPPAARARRPASGDPPPLVRDLPPYDWSSSPPPDGTLPSADRRG